MFVACADPADQVQRLVGVIAGLLRADLATRGTAALAVSGGRSPIPLLEALSRLELDWSRVDVRLVDERCVAPEHADSNAALVRRHLLQHAAAQARFRPLVSAPAAVDVCVAQANADAVALTVAVLGMGEDGHTASLFPHAPQLAAAIAPDCALDYLVLDPVTAPHRRISLSLAALQRCRHLLLAISGSSKLAVYQQACRQATPTLPISLLIHQQATPFDVYWSP